MKSKDIFKLAVRILGLAFVYHGLTALPVAASAVFAAAGNIVSFALTLFMAVWPLAVAYWLLRGAPLIVQIAYPDTTAPSTGETADLSGHKVDA